MSDNLLLKDLLMKAELEHDSEHSIPVWNADLTNNNDTIAVRTEPILPNSSTNAVPESNKEHIPGGCSNNQENGNLPAGPSNTVSTSIPCKVVGGPHIDVKPLISKSSTNTVVDTDPDFLAKTGGSRGTAGKIDPSPTSRFAICPTKLPAELKEKTLQMADALLRL